jgi:hypothetical protein
MAKPGGRLQAEVSRMLRLSLGVFALAWFGILFFLDAPMWYVAVVFAVPGSLVNLVGVVFLMRAYALAWGSRQEDVRSPGRMRGALLAGTWSIAIALVLYVVGLTAFLVGP